jgi:hypothetical protein
MTDYLELIPKPRPSIVNVGPYSPKLSTLRNLLGEPRSSYSGSCRRLRAFAHLTNPQERDSDKKIFSTCAGACGACPVFRAARHNRD